MSKFSPQEDEKWMQEALKLAKNAALQGEVPVGALIVKDGQVLATGENHRENDNNPLGHAELKAIFAASQKLNSWRLSDCTLYVTLEPCLMCSGALVQSRISRVVFGAYDPKGGALVSLFRLGQDPRLNHRFEVSGGTLEKDCATILTEFFKRRRQT